MCIRDSCLVGSIDDRVGCHLGDVALDDFDFRHTTCLYTFAFDWKPPSIRNSFKYSESRLAWVGLDNELKPRFSCQQRRFQSYPEGWIRPFRQKGRTVRPACRAGLRRVNQLWSVTQTSPQQKQSETNWCPVKADLTTRW